MDYKECTVELRMSREQFEAVHTGLQQFRGAVTNKVFQVPAEFYCCATDEERALQGQMQEVSDTINTISFTFREHHLPEFTQEELDVLGRALRFYRDNLVDDQLEGGDHFEEIALVANVGLKGRFKYDD